MFKNLLKTIYIEKKLLDLIKMRQYKHMYIHVTKRTKIVNNQNNHISAPMI